MIITKLNGGLGNQMFEYAHARSLQIENDDDLFLDIEGFEHWNPKYPKRNYSLSALNLSGGVKLLPVEKSRKLLVWQSLSKLNRKLASKIARFFDVYLWKTPNYIELNIGNTKKKTCYLYGYWQSEKYFSDNKEIIREELKVRTPVFDESKPFLKEAEKSNSVCVHIRRGDYVVGNMIFCDEKYYIDGMKYIKARYENANFLVFSDDIEWVKRNLRFEYPVTYVTMEGPDYEVLRIMYTCKHFVISNSSYSWWGQYLSENDDKIVIAPRKWFPSEEYDNSIYQDSWIILGGKDE